MTYSPPPPAVLPGDRFRSGQWYWPPMPHALQSGLQDSGVWDAIAIELNETRILDGLAMRVVTAGSVGSLVQVLAYRDAGDDYPVALAADTGTLSGESASIKEWTGLGVILTPQVYWLCGGAKGNPATRPTLSWCDVGLYNRHMSQGTSSSFFGLGTVPNGYVATLGEGAPPATWPASSGRSGASVAVGFRFA